MPPHRLELEITESALTGEPVRAMEVLTRLNDMQVVTEELPAPHQVESRAHSVHAPVLVNGDSIVPMSAGKAVSVQGSLLDERPARAR